MATKKSKPSKNIHDGHRDRVKEQLLAGGFNDTTPTHVLLETFLYFAIPQKDTNGTAHMLLDTFGSLENVINAPADELMKVKGVGKNTVALFKILKQVNRRIAINSADKVNMVHSHDDIGRYLLKKFAEFNVETAAALMLRPSGKILAFEIIGQGDIAAVGLSVKKIIELTIRHSTQTLVLCHNQPSGLALPSPRDIEITKGLTVALRQIGINMIDHVIIADNDYTSMAQSAEYRNIF